jgi:hypothetical protein
MNPAAFVIPRLNRLFAQKIGKCTKALKYMRQRGVVIVISTREDGFLKRT